VARDPERQAGFYRALFNWQVGEGPVRQIPAGLGAPEPGPAGHIRAGGHPAVVLYVQVRDLRASLDRAQELGAEVMAEPFDIPNGPTLLRPWQPASGSSPVRGYGSGLQARVV
jgi:predicted enzyme related to lactoylglutathione lyase